MSTIEPVVRLSRISGRSAGTDAERRGAVRLHDELRAAGYPSAMQTLWVRPFWALTHGLHAAVAVAGSIVSVSHPAVGLSLLLVSLVSMVGDLSGTFFWGRRLTPRRATQNVVVGMAPAAADRVQLILTANLDAGPAAAIYRDPWVRAEARLGRLWRGHLPSPLGLAALAAVALAALAGARLAGASGPVLGVVQLLPSLYLTMLVAVLADIGLAAPAPGANANASGVAAALTVFEHLTGPGQTPAHLDVHLVLAGAGDQQALGLTGFLRGRARAGWQARDVAVIALEPSGVGRAHYFTHQGPLWAARLHPRLIECARRAADVTGAAPQGRRSHAAGAAYAARRRGWPALAVGALDVRGRPGRARQARDTADRVDPAAVQRCVDLCVALVAELDASLAADHDRLPADHGTMSADHGALPAARESGERRATGTVSGPPDRP